MMAQSNEIQRKSNTPNGQNALHVKSSKAQTSETFQQILQREGSKWSKISTQKMKKNHDQEEKENHHNKMSVLAKVKEKAKRLKHSLGRKKHRDESNSRCTSVTRSSVTAPDDKGEEDVVYYSARMDESKHMTNTNKATGDHPREAPVSIPEKHSTTSPSNTSTEAQTKYRTPSVVAADTDPKNQTPATTDDPKSQDLSESGSRFTDLTVSTSEGETMKGESQTQDKGVSVKEYLMHKFEPGEDERALSQVITQTISPRRDKMREAMSSFLKNEEPSESTNKIPQSEMNSSDVDNTNPNLKSKSLPASTNSDTKTELNIGSINPSHSLGSNGSNASSNLNQTFKSTFASYQNQTLNTGSKESSTHLHSPTDKSLLPPGNETSDQSQVQTDGNEGRSAVSNNASSTNNHGGI